MPREYYNVAFTEDIESLRQEINRIFDSISRRLNSISQDGENVSLGSKKITSLAAGVESSDAIRLDQTFLLDDLASRLLGTANEITVTDNSDETLTFSLTPQIKLDGATASRLLATNASKITESVASLTAWIAGTADHITVSDDGDGTITLTIPTTYLPNHISGTTAEITITDNGDGTITISLPGSIKLDDATASRLLATDGSKKTTSVANLTSWIGASRFLTSDDDGDGTITLNDEDIIRYLYQLR